MADEPESTPPGWAEALAFFGLISDTEYLRMTAHYQGSRLSPEARQRIIDINKSRHAEKRAAAAIDQDRLSDTTLPGGGPSE